MSALPFDTQRAAATLIAFVGTFFIALTVGRFLKRRAEVRLGLLYQLFCLALAFYVAIAVFGDHAERELKGVVATSGAAALILGLAGQNILGGIIAGMSLQINRPYKVGD